LLAWSRDPNYAIGWPAFVDPGNAHRAALRHETHDAPARLTCQPDAQSVACGVASRIQRRCRRAHHQRHHCQQVEQAALHTAYRTRWISCWAITELLPLEPVPGAGVPFIGLWEPRTSELARIYRLGKE